MQRQAQTLCPLEIAMLLLTDIGNTSIKLGLAKDDEIRATYTLPTDDSQSADGFGLQLRQLTEHAALGEDIDACIISSVVPGIEPAFRRACERFFGLRPLFAHRELEVPLENHYEMPQEVGADRIVAAYGARRLFPDPASIICVDYGTATTFDCVTEQAYLGGMICPGVMSSLGALATRTARLPRIALETCGNAPIIGRNTVTSLNHGFLFGFSAMTEGLCARLSNTLPGPVFIVATGGFAENVAQVTKCINAVRPDLILESLRLLYKEKCSY
jgi:type III pantothenate kinase